MGLASNTATSGNKPDKISLFKTWSVPYLPLLVIEAYNNSTRYFEEIPSSPKGIAPSHSMDAYYLAYCVLKFSFEFFGMEAEETLHEWNIHNSEDIGKIVYGLISIQLLEAQDGDSIKDFNNLFKVTQEVISNINL